MFIISITPTKPRRKTRWSILTLLVICLPQTLIIALKQQPQPRSYDSHAYYVIETTPTSSGPSSDPISGQSIAQDLADRLDTEFVERVGELENFWLIKAPKTRVERGYQLFIDPSSSHHQLHPRSLPEKENPQPKQPRDSVLEHFQLIRRSAHDPLLESQINHFDHKSRQKRSLPKSTLSARHLAYSIRSLERQVLRQRHKRDLIYVPTPNGPAPLSPRQTVSRPTKGGKILSPSQQVARQFNIYDPLWPKQWHLVNDVIHKHMINATGVWEMGITGKNVTVAIVDDGIDMSSDDLKSNFFEAGSWDYNDHTPLPEPRLPDDLHGTRCAGEIAAVRNDVCGVGVAFDGKVAGIRILSASISDADEASALNYGYQENHIYSCSWGPPDDGKSMEAPSRLIFKAMLNGIQKGRGGKGSVFVFASGNGGAVDDQCNFDGYTNSIYSVTISAIDRQGLHPYYSEVCSANMVVTYSSGSGDNIHTTDVGKNKCTDRHGGTSAAAPLGAGIFALVLQARPDLTWRDVQYLAVTTAIPFSLEDPDWQKTASGRLYNHKFGFGNMDAYQIVQAAKTWKLVKPQAWWTSANVNAHSQPVTAQGANATIVVSQADLDGANFESLEHITVAVNIKHTRRGNVRVLLISPHGSVSILAAHRRYDDASTGFPGWVFMTVKHWGENPVGAWTLSVQDPIGAPDTNGTFEDWAMGMWGECKDPTIQKLFKMPDDAEILLPPSPVSGVALETVMPGLSSSVFGAAATPPPVPLKNPPPLVSDTSMGFSKTKSFVKPTAHLPADHAGNTGAPGDVVTGMGSMSGYLKGKSSWVFVAFGIAIVLGGCLCGWFFLLRMRRRHDRARFQNEVDQGDQGVGLLSGARRPGGLFQQVLGKASTRRGNGYGFEPVAGEEDLPMRSLGRGPLDKHPKPGLSKPKSTTKDLYDAFGNVSGSEDESDNENVDGKQQREDLKKTRAAPYNDIDVDDEYMDSFLEDPDVNSPLASRTSPTDDNNDQINNHDDEDDLQDLED
ncbi:kexin [Puccinia graminis f. sp. tritici CRL 75-36-700-3]|uniref:Kexin n=2 Tax=Puccinia graminis f. sp. tritici TaxID=56615 RepID=E3KGS2_PUCGT|nr:kexin [Puccinia graminis f. sp. tritici CRL 75-36-700-3]EFP83497.2 kexin [Puccinia graminis f. sp. tritici CRL 75-36-700-3]